MVYDMKCWIKLNLFAVYFYKKIPNSVKLSFKLWIASKCGSCEGFKIYFTQFVSSTLSIFVLEKKRQNNYDKKVTLHLHPDKAGLLALKKIFLLPKVSFLLLIIGKGILLPKLFGTMPLKQTVGNVETSLIVAFELAENS